MSDQRYTYEFTKGASGAWWWHVRYQNGRILADSGEGYSTKSNAKRALRRFKWAVLRAIER